MCPLRIILIFLSATLAGFFVLRNLNSSPDPLNDDGVDVAEEAESTGSAPMSSKVCAAVGKGFWTFVDMASGKYLWRNLASSSSPTEKLSAD
ncbi:hypothetical protein ACP275_04G083700 [Erythranthe tilingii]